LLTDHYRIGQFVIDLPVSTEISVKGGKGIWGMPKHRASLSFDVDEKQKRISAQYDLDGQLAAYVEIAHPGRAWMPVNARGTNYCGFRGSLMASYVAFQAKLAVGVFGGATGRFVVGDHPRLAALKKLEHEAKPFVTLWMPTGHGVLDDHYESWFLTSPKPIETRPEGMESVVGLGLDQTWPEPPKAPVPPAEPRGKKS
jgi:hypothetical protein